MEHEVRHINDLLQEPGETYGQYPAFKYEKLHVFGLARKLRKDFYLVARQFPDFERYGMSSQIQRSALSVVLNLAEGTLRPTGKDQAKFTAIAYGSLHEAFVCVGEAEVEGYLVEGTQNSFRQEVDQLSRMLSKLREFQLRQL